MLLPIIYSPPMIGPPFPSFSGAMINIHTDSFLIITIYRSSNKNSNNNRFVNHIVTMTIDHDHWSADDPYLYLGSAMVQAGTQLSLDASLDNTQLLPPVAAVGRWLQYMNNLIDWSMYIVITCYNAVKLVTFILSK